MSSASAIFSKPAALAIAIVVTVLAAAWGLRSSEGERALRDSDAASSRGETTDAILFARQAAEARCPFCAAPAKGFGKLEKIATDAETRADDATAFGAWRAVRAAALATTLDGDSPWRSRADRELARIGHHLDTAAVATGATPSPAASEARLSAALAANDMPNSTTYGLVGLGGLLFLGAAARFATGADKRVQNLIFAIAGAGIALFGLILF